MAFFLFPGETSAAGVCNISDIFKGIDNLLGLKQIRNLLISEKYHYGSAEFINSLDRRFEHFAFPWEDIAVITIDDIIGQLNCWYHDDDKPVFKGADIDRLHLHLNEEIDGLLNKN